MLYGKSVLFPKSERYLNNVLYLKSVELTDTTGKINAGTLTDLQCLNSEDVKATTGKINAGTLTDPAPHPRGVATSSSATSTRSCGILRCCDIGTTATAAAAQ